MFIKILYFFSILVIVIGMAMLLTNQIATPHFKNGSGGHVELILHGSHVIFIGVIMLTVGWYVQKNDNQQ